MRRAVWASVIVGGGIAAWLIAHDDAPAPPPDARASAAQPERPREKPSDAQVAARRQKALRDLMARHAAPTRLVKVRVVDCGLVPAAHAEVNVEGGGEIVKGLADDVGVFRAQVPVDAALVTAHARGGDRSGIASGGADVAALDVVICPGATVEGVVHDAAGRPLADAVVRFADGQDVAVTEGDGEFVLSDMYLTSDAVVVEHASGLAALTLSPPLAPGETRAVTIVVEGGRRVAGAVLDRGGVAAPNVPLVAVDATGAVVARATADRDGRFWLKRLPLGVLHLRAEGGPKGLGEVTLGANEQRDDVVVRLGLDRAALTVVWEGADEGVIVVTAVGVGDGADPIVSEAVTVASGDERWVATPAVYRTVVHTAQGEVACGEVFLAGGEREVVRCGAPKPAQLVARVLGPDGRPRAGVSWGIRSETGEEQRGVTDGAGRLVARFELDRAVRIGLEIGRPEPDVDMLSRRNITLSPGSTTDLGDVQLRDVEAVRAMFTERETGTFGGLGGMLERDPLGIAFARIVRDGPLDRAGVRPGDVVLDIDGQSAGHLTEREVTLRLRGAPGSSVALRLMRRGEGMLDIRLDRALIDTGAGWVD